MQRLCFISTNTILYYKKQKLNTICTITSCPNHHIISIFHHNFLNTIFPPNLYFLVYNITKKSTFIKILPFVNIIFSSFSYFSNILLNNNSLHSKVQDIIHKKNFGQYLKRYNISLQVKNETLEI